MIGGEGKREDKRDEGEQQINVSGEDVRKMTNKKESEFAEFNFMVVLLLRQVTNLDYDEHKGRIAIGRVAAGRISRGQSVKICKGIGGPVRTARVGELFVYDNFARVPAEEVEGGDICALSGLEDVQVGPTFLSGF